MKLKKKLGLLLAILSLSAIAPVSSAGTLLLNNLNSGTPHDSLRSPEFGILAEIIVGAQNVQIDQFGVFGRQIFAGNIRFDIFDSAKNRIYDSGSISVSGANANQWYDTSTFSLMLSAGQTYYFGLLSDQNFSYHYEDPAPADVGIGLTSPMSGNQGSNGNFDTFSNPTVVNYGFFAQQSTRIFGLDTSATDVDVPEPASLALLGLGLAGVAVARRRKA